jgi:hypothetical protein
VTDASHPPPPAAGSLSPIGSGTAGRLVFWLLVLFAAGVLWPFTTALHNICLPQAAAAELLPLAGLLLLLLGAVFAGELRLARTPLLRPLLACLAVLLLTGLLAEFRYAAAEHLARQLGYFALFLLAVQAVRTRKDLARLALALALILAVPVGYGLLQGLWQDPFVAWRQQVRVVTGTLGGPPYLAAVMLATFPVLLAAAQPCHFDTIFLDRRQGLQDAPGGPLFSGTSKTTRLALEALPGPFPCQQMAS